MSLIEKVKLAKQRLDALLDHRRNSRVMNSQEIIIHRREVGAERRRLLRLGVTMGGAAALGAVAMRGYDKAYAFPNNPQTANLGEWLTESNYDILVYGDNSGNYWTKDGNTGQATKQAATTTAGWQEAIALLQASGGSIYVKPGNYPTTTTITTYPWIEIYSDGPMFLNNAYGSGQGTATLYPNASLNAPVIQCLIDPAAGRTARTFNFLHDFGIWGTGTGGSSQHGIDYEDTNGVWKDAYMERVFIDSVGGDAFHVDSASIKLWAYSLYAELNAGAGFAMNTVSTSGGFASITNCNFSSNSAQGFLCGGASGGTYGVFELEGCRIYNNTLEGIKCLELNLPCGVMNNHIRDNGGSTIGDTLFETFEGGGYIRFVGNDIIEDRGSGTAKYGLWIGSGATPVRGVFTDNIILPDTPFATANYKIATPTPTALVVKNNQGINPIGRIASPFDTSNNYIAGFVPGGSDTMAAAPVASTTYTVVGTDCIIIFTAVGSTSLVINGGGAFTPVAGGAYPVPLGSTVNFGAFGGSPPTVQVDFN